MSWFLQTKYRKRALHIIPIFFLILAFPCPSLADASVNVSVDSWVYPALQRVISAGLIRGGLKNTRPLARMEVARLIGEAMKAGSEQESARYVDGTTLHLLNRLIEEFRHELSILGAIDGAKVETFIKPVDKIWLKHYVLDGNHAVYNNDGIMYGDGHNATLEFSGRGTFFKGISVFYQPMVKYLQRLDSDEDTELTLEKGYLKFDVANVEFEIGRDSLWWGPGEHGSLLLTNNARPFDMVKVSNPQPILLPWIFRYLGPFKAVWFITRLGEERAIPEPYLSGLRVNFKPLPYLELGISRVAMAGGEGRPGLDAGDIIDIIGGKNTSGGTEDTSNQIASMDLSLQLSFLKNTEIYGEWGGEDEAGYLPTKHAYLVGIYVPRFTRNGRVDLRIEYANNHVSGFPDVWYNHSIYETGYRYKGSIIGHHMDSDSEDLLMRSTSFVANDLRVGIDFDFENRGKSNLSQEEHYQYGVDLSYNITNMTEVTGRYGFEKVINHDFVAGEEKSHHLVGAGLAVRF